MTPEDRIKVLEDTVKEIARSLNHRINDLQEAVNLQRKEIKGIKFDMIREWTEEDAKSDMENH